MLRGLDRGEDERCSERVLPRSKLDGPIMYSACLHYIFSRAVGQTSHSATSMTEHTTNQQPDLPLLEKNSSKSGMSSISAYPRNAFTCKEEFSNRQVYSSGADDDEIQIVGNNGSAHEMRVSSAE
jgi:hypothetical protein